MHCKVLSNKNNVYHAESCANSRLKEYETNKLRGSDFYSSEQHAYNCINSEYIHIPYININDLRLHSSIFVKSQHQNGPTSTSF